ncbi:MAG: hypothetical protein AAF899_15595, partial [Pseudomonadota bacterium]
MSGTTLPAGGRALTIGRVAGMPVAHLVLIGVVALLLFWGSLRHGMPYGNSYHYNLTWTNEVAEQMAAGTLYPRWLPSTWGGAGSPDFYFYPPLFFLVSGAFTVLSGLGAAFSQVWTAMLFHAVSGIGTWRLARSLEIAPLGCLAAAIALMAAPYHLIDWVIRNANAELAGYAALGFVLSGAIDVMRRRRGHLVLGCATMAAMLSHILLAPIAGLACAVLTLVFWRDATLRRLVEATVAGVAGVVAAGVYVVPAMLLRHTVDDEVLTDYHWSAHLLTLDNLGGTIVAWVYAANALHLAVIVIVLLALRHRLPAAAAAVAALTALCWFMWSPLAAPLYAHTPLEMLQFPWRFSVLADHAWALAVGMAVAGLAASASMFRRIVLGAALVLTTAGLLLFQPAFWQAPRATLWEPWTVYELRISPLEWLSAGTGERPFSFEDLKARQAPLPPLDGAPTVRVDGGSVDGGSVTVIAEAAREITFATTCESSCAVTFRRNYWAFWRLVSRDDGAEVALAPARPHPLATAVLPAGEHRWRLRLERPAVEYAGWAVSGLGILGLVAMALVVRRRERVGEESGRGKQGHVL